MRILELGHVVLKVRDRAIAEEFYGDVLGLRIVARMDSPAVTFFSLGHHHDFAVLAVGDDAPKASAASPGLAHVAFRVGSSVDELREAKRHLESRGVEIRNVSDHTVSQSIYFRDPDDNTIEVYVDTSDVWRTDPQAVATIAPLTL